jgi:ketosteroid isomerase-like protein
MELVRRVIDHANTSGELGAEFDTLIHPAIDFKDEIGAYSTRDELRQFLQGFAEAIGGLHVEVQDTRDLGETLVLMVLQSGKGASSGAPVAQPFTWVMEFESNRCVRWRIYADRERALEAAGLSE